MLVSETISEYIDWCSNLLITVDYYVDVLSTGNNVINRVGQTKTRQKQLIRLPSRHTDDVPHLEHQLSLYGDKLTAGTTPTKT